MKITQDNSVNVKLSNSQLKKLKLGMKNGTEVTSNFSSNVIGDFIDENNFPKRISINRRQVSKFCKASTNNSSANIKLSKPRISKMLQWGRFLDNNRIASDYLNLMRSLVNAAAAFEEYLQGSP